MNLTKLVTFLGSTVLLASCGGGGGGSAPPPVAKTIAAPSNGVVTGLVINVGSGSKTISANRRSPKQITSDVTALLVIIDGIGTRYLLTPILDPACTGSSPNYTCNIAASVGSHLVDVRTETGAGPFTDVGYSLPQENVTISLGQITPLTFTLTPVAGSFSGATTTPAAGHSLPEDGAVHPVALTMDVLALNGQVISAPIDTQNLFGTVTLSTYGYSSMPGPTQAAVNSSTGSYSDGPYTFNYNGAQMAGNVEPIYAVYSSNQGDIVDPNNILVEQQYNSGVTAPGPPAGQLVFTIPLTRLDVPAISYPAGATLGGATFDATNSWYYFPPNISGVPTVPVPNNSNTAVIVFNNAPPATQGITINVSETNDISQVVLTGSCNTAGGAGQPIWTTATTTGTQNGLTPIAIQQPAYSGQTAPCVLTVSDGQFPTLTQSINVYPSPGSFAISTQSGHRLN